MLAEFCALHPSFAGSAAYLCCVHCVQNGPGAMCRQELGAG